MKKIIEIENCIDCPFEDNFFHVLHKSYCRRLTTFKQRKGYNNQILIEKEVLIPKKGILKECPLENSEDYVKSNFNIDKDD